MRFADCLVALAVACQVSCAKRTDERTRDAFHSARGMGDSRDGDNVRRGSGQGSGVFERDKFGWDRVSEFLKGAVIQMRTAPSDARLAELATQWCAVEPEPKSTTQGLVRVCNPKPPVVADGTSFSLELGGEGVIGLVAIDLTRDQAEKVAASARDAMRPMCTEPWVETAQDPEEPVHFHMCPAAGGPLITVGRFPRSPNSPRWLVSVAVLSPG